MGIFRVPIGICRVTWGYIGLHRDNGRETGNYHSGIRI